MRSQSSNYQHEKDISKQLRKTNYYEILDLKKNATQAEIKKSFKQMALKYHPDKNSANYSKQAFHKVSQAYDTLSDPAKRNAYDQKQQLLKCQGQSNSFKEPTVFFHKSSSKFESYFEHQFRWSAFDYARRKAHEERMDEKARHEREKFKKQQQQKGKAENWGKAFFKSSEQKNSKKAQQFNENEKKQAEIQQKQRVRQRSYFGFTKPKTTNQKQSQYEQRRRQRQRKQRIQRQRQKANKNLSMFMLFMLAIVFWIYLDYNKVSFRGPSVYSINQSTTHNISMFTQKLQSPFFVTQDYIQRADADNRFKQYIDRKMDFAYIKLLSRICNNAKHQHQSIKHNLAIVKSNKTKKQLDEQLKMLDLSSCTKLHLIRQINPVYFQALFSANSPKQQL